MRARLLPEWILCGFLVDLTWPRCGGRGLTWRVSRPALTLAPDVAVLDLPARCVCGARQTKRVSLPVLQLGVIFVHGAAIDLCLAGTCPSQAEIRVSPRPSDHLFRICREYHQVVNRLMDRALTDAMESEPDDGKTRSDPPQAAGTRADAATSVRRATSGT
jgi:hypothetical protein